MTSTRDIPTPDVNELVARCRALVETNSLETVIVAGSDASGILRGKRIAAERFAADPTAGVPLSDLVLVVDVRGDVVVRPKHFEGWWPSGETTGHADVLLVPDLTTVRALPWADRAAIVLGDFHHVDGSPVSASAGVVLDGCSSELRASGSAPGWRLSSSSMSSGTHRTDRRRPTRGTARSTWATPIFSCRR